METGETTKLIGAQRKYRQTGQDIFFLHALCFLTNHQAHPNKDLFKDLILMDLGGCKGLGGELAIASIGMLTIKMDGNDGRSHLIQFPT